MLDRLRQLYGYEIPPMGPVAFSLFRRFGPKAIKTELFPGIYADLNLHDSTQTATWWQGSRFEQPTGKIIRHWLKNNVTTFFDIGANYGFFSYLALSSSTDVVVHAFEPHPVTFQRLATIKSKNDLRRLNCWNIGLGDSNVELDLQSGVEDLGHTTFGTNPTLPNEKISKVQIRHFGDWLQSQNIALPSKPQWIAKIDVEGFELNVLNGMRDALTRKCFKGLVVEINEFTLKFCQTTPEAIYQFLDDVGYRARLPQKIDTSFLGTCGNAFFVPK